MQAYPTFRYYYSGGSGDADTVGDGQLLIGSSGGIPIVGAIQAGPGIVVDNGPGSITITASLEDPLVIEATSIINTVTSSVTDVLLDSAITTPGSGDFLVFFSGIVASDAPTTSSVTFSIYVNGVQVPSSMTAIEASKDEPHNVTTMTYVSGLGPGEDIEVRWHVESGVDIGTFHERRLIVQRIRLN